MLARLVACVVTLFGIIAMSPAFAQDFAVGQIWSYKNRPTEAGSEVLINKIEDDPKLGLIFHISVLIWGNN
jgi:hypothetical protein